MPAGFIGYPAQLRVSSDGSSFTKIAYVETLGELGAEAADVEVTNMDSPNGYREYIGGLRDPSELSFGCVWDPDDATHDATSGLIAMFDSQAVLYWELICADPSSTKGSFQGRVKSYKISTPKDDKSMLNINIKMSGGITWS